MAIVISDTTTGESVPYEGDWIHAPQKRSPLSTLPDPDFHVDRGTFSLRMIPLLCDKGLTHCYGSECSAVKSTFEKNNETKLSPADAAAMIREAQIKMREDMESDRWASGQRTRSGPTISKQDQLFASDVAVFVRKMLNEGFAKDGANWVNPADGVSYPLTLYVDGFLANPGPSEGVDEVDGFAGPGVTLGQARRAKFMAAVVARMNTAAPKTLPTI